ncbi:hypothetical protein AB0D24_23675 [Streptomyces javensis]|uniref:hypothetical protein n=1 Tax=Streptomyces javensis TaxID=114698 RepID=UPI0034111DA1
MHIHGDPDGRLGALQVATGPGVAAIWTEDDYAQATFAISLDEPRMVWQRAGF